MISAIDAISTTATGTSALTGFGTSSISSANQSGSAAPFADLMQDAIGEVDQLQGQAKIAVDGLMTGSGVDVHQAMIATQKASMAFELALSVRNKALQAYQSVMGMQF